MNWIQGIQRAIDYVEANITEEIDFEETARQACSSSFHKLNPFVCHRLLPLPSGGGSRQENNLLAFCQLLYYTQYKR